MRILLLSCVIFFGALASNAQSNNPSDYLLVFEADVPHFVDSTSLETSKNGNKAFWTLFPFEGKFAVISIEANCRTRKVRMRSTFFIVNGYPTMRNNSISPWMGEDVISRSYVEFSCGKSQIQNRPLVKIPNSDF